MIAHRCRDSPWCCWGVASEALRDIITGFLDEVRFD
jgi:hypothetical protein